MYELVAEEQGVSADQINGTIQNDLLKEYIARGTYIFPPRPSMRIITDIFEYCSKHVPSWNTISISGYHIREAGSTAVQEIAFTLANAIAYVQAAVDAGLDVDDFAPRLSFFWNGHNNFFEEAAKFRASRRMWHTIMTERFWSQEPEVEDAAIPHADRRLDTHRAAADEQRRARRDPVDGRSARWHPVAPHQRLRRSAQPADRDGGTHRAADTADHRLRVGGDRHSRPARRLVLCRVDDRRNRNAWRGSTSTPSTTRGERSQRSSRASRWTRSKNSAYEYTKSIDDEERVIVGVNKFEPTMTQSRSRFRSIPSSKSIRSTRTSATRQLVTPRRWSPRSARSRRPPSRATTCCTPSRMRCVPTAHLGEISDSLREVFGVYTP